MSRCGDCKYSKCPGDYKCIRKDCVLFNKYSSSFCTCVQYNFDEQENCPKYEQNTEEQDGT